MNISKKCIDLIKQFEGLRLTAYQDGGGVWTIGYGHTGKVDGMNIAKGMKITIKKAEELLNQDLIRFEKHVRTYHHKYNFTQNEFDALVSFSFNLGSINQLTANGTRTKEEISRKIVEYSNMRISGKLTWIKGLHIRRLKETLMFLSNL